MNNRHKSELIRRYFRTGCLSSIDKLLVFLHYSIPYYKNSKKIYSIYRSISEEPFKTETSVEILNYQYANSHALEMKQFLEKNLNARIIGAYTHGSLGTDELINYSDFDGLVILNHSAFQSPVTVYKTAIKLHKSERIMRKMDPLQHHGWFLITEKELIQYPVDYFPVMLFSYAKCLTGKNNLFIKYSLTSDAELQKHFEGFCNHLKRNIQKNITTSNYYDLKSMLSGFMLLPAIYIQLRHPEGVFKKESFNLLRKEMSPNDYKVMDSVSQIRNEWNYTSPGRFHWLQQIDNAFLNHYFYKKWSGNIDPALAKKINEIKPEMLKFIDILIKNA